MNISNASFGKIVVVSGPKKQLKEINTALQKQKDNEELMTRDITQPSKYLSTDGLISKAAQSGSNVYLYVTDEDLANVRQKKEGWRSKEELICKFDKYINLAKTSIDDTIKEIIGGVKVK